MALATIEGAGLRIVPVPQSGNAPYDVWGAVTSREFKEYGRIYYCAGRSFPASIVERVYQNEVRDEARQPV